MSHDSQLHTFMCEFELIDGQKYSESDFPNGWSEFPYKKQVASIKFQNRTINPKDTMQLDRSTIKGFAIHWIGRSVVGGEDNPYMVREIMMVLPNKKVYVCSFNTVTKKWQDYMDNLRNPERPHLNNYDLRIHGMGII